MATFNRDDAKIQEVYVRRVLPNGDNNYRRLAFNLITYDNGTTYIEPVPTVNDSQTWEGMNSVATDGEWLILDVPPFSGITEIR